MLCGSCVGAVTWAAWMQVIVNYVIGVDTRHTTTSRAARDLFLALSARWQAVFAVTYAIEFLCLSTAKLLVLDRMSDFLASGGSSRLRVAAGRIVMAAVVVGNLVGLAGNIAAAVYYDRVAGLLIGASDDAAANNTLAARQKRRDAFDSDQLAFSISFVQSSCEVAVLLLIVAAFVTAGAASARRIREISAMIPAPIADAVTPAMTAGRHLQRQIVATTVVVFVAFLLRSVYSTLYAVAAHLQDVANTCPGDAGNACNPSCYNVFSHIFHWIFITPQFQLSVVLISQPFALLVALWNMTSKRIRRQMQQSEQFSGHEIKLVTTRQPDVK